METLVVGEVGCGEGVGGDSGGERQDTASTRSW